MRFGNTQGNLGWNYGQKNSNSQKTENMFFGIGRNNDPDNVHHSKDYCKNPFNTVKCATPLKF